MTYLCILSYKLRNSVRNRKKSIFFWQAPKFPRNRRGHEKWRFPSRYRKFHRERNCRESKSAWGLFGTISQSEPRLRVCRRKHCIFNLFDTKPTETRPIITQMGKWTSYLHSAPRKDLVYKKSVKSEVWKFSQKSTVDPLTDFPEFYKWACYSVSMAFRGFMPE